MGILQWMKNSFGFHIFMICFISFTTLHRIMQGAMNWLMFMLNAICLYIFINGAFKIREAKKQENKNDSV